MPCTHQILVSNRQREILQRLVDAKKTPQQLAERARIVLMSEEGFSNVEQARILDVDRQRVRRWRRRWAVQEEALRLAEKRDASDRDLQERVTVVLSDCYRSGAPQRFSAEQVAQVLALACESPADSGVPISHWTPADLTRELLKRGVFETVSPRSVDRFLKGGRHPATQGRILDAAQREGPRTLSAASRARMRGLRPGD